MDQKEIKQFIHSARVDNDASFDLMEKHSFVTMLTGMKVKLLKRVIDKGSSEELETQIASIGRMENFLDRLTFKNCVFYFQAKTILSQDRRIAILEQEKMDLIKSKAALVTRAKTKVELLEKELNNIKKRIKNDKESS